MHLIMRITATKSKSVKHQQLIYLVFKSICDFFNNNNFTIKLPFSVTSKGKLECTPTKKVYRKVNIYKKKLSLET